MVIWTALFGWLSQALRCSRMRKKSCFHLGWICRASIPLDYIVHQAEKQRGHKTEEAINTIIDDSTWFVCQCREKFSCILDSSTGGLGHAEANDYPNGVCGRKVVARSGLGWIGRYSQTHQFVESTLKAVENNVVNQLVARHERVKSGEKTSKPIFVVESQGGVRHKPEWTLLISFSLYTWLQTMPWI